MEKVLVVGAALPVHDFKGRVVLSPRTMKELSFSMSDPVGVFNECALFDGGGGDGRGDLAVKWAVGVAYPSASLAKDSVELDKIIRNNCRIKIGDFVTVRKLDCGSYVVDADGLCLDQINDDSGDRGLSQSYEVMHLFLRYNLTDQYLVVGNEVVASIYGRLHKFVLRKATTVGFETASPNTIYRVHCGTKITIANPSTKIHLEKLTFSHIGGLDAQIKDIKTLIETPLKNPDLFSRYGIKPPRGVLLYGSPGTGKTLLARILAHEMQVPFYTISVPEIMSNYYGESEAKLRLLFERARLNSPSLIFIDEIDSIAPNRDKSDSETSKRIVGTLLTLMDGVNSESNAGILILASTNRPNDIDPALRRPGRFDKEIELPIPNERGRLEILNLYLKNMAHTLTTEQIKEISSRMHGYVGADISNLCKEAGLKSLKRAYREMEKKLSGIRIFPSEDLTENDMDKQLSNQVRVNWEDMNEAFCEIRPSAMREIMVDIPKVLWTDIGGYENVKQKLREAAEWPLKYPEAFQRMGIDPPRGILLYGPPGCSKTLLAKALATQTGLNFIPIKGPELFSKYVGDSEKAVREVFRKARAAAPSIVFFDEVDAIGGERGSSHESNSVHDRVLAQMLNELDGIERLNRVLFLAATNRPDIIDKALMRPGRIDRIIYVGPPDFQARREIFGIQLKKIPHEKDLDVEMLARRSEGLTGAEITSVCREACLAAMQDNIQVDLIASRYFEDALTEALKTTLTPESVAFYKNF